MMLEANDTKVTPKEDEVVLTCPQLDVDSPLTPTNREYMCPHNNHKEEGYVITRCAKSMIIDQSNEDNVADKLEILHGDFGSHKSHHLEGKLRVNDSWVVAALTHFDHIHKIKENLCWKTLSEQEGLGGGISLDESCKL